MKFEKTKSMYNPQNEEINKNSFFKDKIWENNHYIYS